MGKKDMSEAITKINPQVNLPAFMKDTTDLGTELLKKYVIPPRIKVVQKQAAQELLDKFAAGDVILSPMNAVVVELPRDNKGRPVDGATASFPFVPLFFWPEWVTWNPIEMRGKLPAVRYRTVDPSDAVALKAKNPNLRHEEIDGVKVRHVEHLNFVVVLYNSEVTSEPCVMSFARGEYSAGTKFASLLKMRRAPIYGCVFSAAVSPRHGQLGDWHGIDVSNPTEGSPWVTEDEFKTFGALHDEFKKYHDEHRLQATLEDETSDDAAAAASPSEF